MDDEIASSSLEESSSQQNRDGERGNDPQQNENQGREDSDGESEDDDGDDEEGDGGGDEDDDDGEEDDEEDEDGEDDDGEEDGDDRDAKDDRNNATADDMDEEDDDAPTAGEEKKSKKRKKSSTSKRKKMRRGYEVNRFFDEYAEEDDDGGEEDDEVREAGEIVTTEYEQEAIERQRAGRQRLKDLFGGEAAAIAQRYEEQERIIQEEDEMYREVGDLYRANTQIAQQSLLPSAKDPRIFMVKCSPKKEQELCRSVMNKALAVYEKTRLLKVKSAFCGAARGYIFIEALAEAQVKEIIMGLKGLYMGKVVQVSVADMTSTLRVKLKKKPLVVGQFVRMKRGPLKGDLVRILKLKEGDTKAEIQAIPRIDYDEPVAKEAKSVKLSAGQKQRPPAALFDAERAFALEDSGLDRDSRFGFYNWRNNVYKDGFLIKTVDVAAYIDAQGAAPTLEELRVFQLSAQRNDADPDAGAAEYHYQTQVNFNEQLTAQIAQLEGLERVPYVAGDVVRVMHGETAGMLGRVLAVDELRHVLRVQMQGAAHAQLVLEVEERFVVKHVEVGAHVKVMAGRSAGLTGRVVAVAEPFPVLVTDGTNREISVNIASLQRSADVAVGHSDLQGFRLYDLIQLSENDAGVVVHVGSEQLRVLNQFDRVVDVDPATVRTKLNVQSTRAMRFDAQNKPFRVGDSVKVVSGPHAKLTGTVKHLHKGYTWLHSDTQLRNSGVFVVKVTAVLLSGSAQTKPTAAPVRKFGNQTATSTPQSLGGGLHQAAQRGARDPLLGRTVRIIKGMHRGKLAQIHAAVSGFYSMELLAQLKKVDLPREHFVIYDPESNGDVGRTNDFALPTDERGLPMTPHIGLATPAYTGSETPSYFGAQTPRRMESEGDAWHVGEADLSSDLPGSRSSFLPETPSVLSSTLSPPPMLLGTPAQSQPFAPPPPPPAAPPATAAPAAPAALTSADPSTWIENTILLCKHGELTGRLVVLRALPDADGLCRVQQRDGSGRLISDEIVVPAASLAQPTKLPTKCTAVVIAGKLKGVTGTVNNQVSKDVVLSVDGKLEYVKANHCLCLNSPLAS